jgi:hypothetical protein
MSSLSAQGGVAWQPFPNRTRGEFRSSWPELNKMTRTRVTREQQEIKSRSYYFSKSFLVSGYDLLLTCLLIINLGYLSLDVSLLSSKGL